MCVCVCARVSAAPLRPLAEVRARLELLSPHTCHLSYWEAIVPSAALPWKTLLLYVFGENLSASRRRDSLNAPVPSPSKFTLL